MAPCPYLAIPSPLLFSIRAPLPVSLMAPSITEVKLHMCVLRASFVQAFPQLESVLVKKDLHLYWSRHDTFSQEVVLQHSCGMNG